MNVFIIPFFMVFFPVTRELFGMFNSSVLYKTLVKCQCLSDSNLNYYLSFHNLFLIINIYAFPLSSKHFWGVIKNVLGLYLYFSIVYRYFFLIWSTLNIFKSIFHPSILSRSGIQEQASVNVCMKNTQSRSIAASSITEVVSIF